MYDKTPVSGRERKESLQRKRRKSIIAFSICCRRPHLTDILCPSVFRSHSFLLSVLIVVYLQLAYQLNSAWLPHFLDAGAGSSKNKRWVLTEVLSCAIAKNDLVSVEVLVRKYPDLLTRDHQLWSKPLIQVRRWSLSCP